MEPTPPAPDYPLGRPTIRDVARLAGVSIKTVSRVVNDEPNVSASARAVVESAVQRLSYRPNTGASALRRTHGRTRTVGVLLRDLSDFFCASALRAVEDTARERGHTVLAASLDEDGDREIALVRDLVQRRVDGLVVMPATSRQEYMTAELAAHLPIVLLCRPPVGIDCDSVVMDDRAAAQIAAEHLLTQGHRRVAMLTDLPTTSTTARERLAGFEAAHAGRGISIDPSLVAGGLLTADDAARTVIAMLETDDPPTAVYAGTNRSTDGVVRALAARGQSRSVAVVGVDEFALADLLQPGLTAIRQDAREVGLTGARLLFERIDGSKRPPSHVVLAPTLVARGSGEILAPT